MSPAEGAGGRRRLLRDLLALGRLQQLHPTARERLEAELGPDLTRRLLESLRTMPQATSGIVFRKVG